jgi:hypothetical protein
LVIVTSSCEDFVSGKLRLQSVFDAVCQVPRLTSQSQVMTVIESAGSTTFNEDELAELRVALERPPLCGLRFEMGVKRVMEIIDLAKQAPTGEGVSTLVKKLTEEVRRGKDGGRGTLSGSDDSYMRLYT